MATMRPGKRRVFQQRAQGTSSKWDTLVSKSQTLVAVVAVVIIVIVVCLGGGGSSSNNNNSNNNNNNSHLLALSSSSSLSPRRPVRIPNRLAAVAWPDDLDLDFDNLGRCGGFRVRGYRYPKTDDPPLSLTAEQVAAHFQQQLLEKKLPINNTNAGSNGVVTINVGIQLVEHWEDFVSFQLTKMHYFHYLEMLIIAFAELVFVKRYMQAALGLHHPRIVVRPQWVYHAYMTPQELCGPAGGINCLVFMYLFHPQAVVSAPSEAAVLEAANQFGRGMEHNSQHMIETDIGCEGNRAKRPGSPTDWKPAGAELQNQRHHDMQSQVDAVVFVDRNLCSKHDTTSVNKMWMGYLDSFPAEDWYQSVRPIFEQASNETTTTRSSSRGKRGRFVACYMDRQGWGRDLPDHFHQWLVEYFESLTDKLDFHHLKMEHYSPAGQLRVASTCNLMLGAHGNAMSHQFWMPPGSYVMEYFWKFNFQFDYATISELMRHKYLALVNGAPVNPKRVDRHDSKLQDHGKVITKTSEEVAEDWVRGKAAIQEFVQTALTEWAHEHAETERVRTG